MNYKDNRRRRGSLFREQRHRKREVNDRQNISDGSSTQSHGRQRHNSSSRSRTTSSDRESGLSNRLYNHHRRYPNTDEKRSNRRFVDIPNYDRLRNRKELHGSVEVESQSSGTEQPPIDGQYKPITEPNEGLHYPEPSEKPPSDYDDNFMSFSPVSESSTSSTYEREVVGNVVSYHLSHVNGLPKVCTYYNAKGCKNKLCHFLHICKHFVIGNCKFNPCKRSHRLTDDQPYAILRDFNLGHFVGRGEEESILLGKLANVLEHKYVDYKEEPTFSGTLGRATGKRCSTSFLFNRASDRNWEWKLRPSHQNWFGPVDYIDEAEIERKFQLYLQSREQIRIGGEEIRINFEKMEGLPSDERKSPIYFKRIQRHSEMKSPTPKKRRRENYY